MVTTRGGATVLLVEDDAAARELFRTVLREAGLNVIAVEDGLDALHFVDTRVPDLVVLDMALPRVSGRDVYRELRARPPTKRVPIIAVSGHDMADLDASDFACILRKPLPIDTLVDVVRQCIRPRRGSAQGV